MPIICKNGVVDFRIYINGNIHIHFLRKNYIGLQSYYGWRDSGEKNQLYFIEIYFKDKVRIKLEYDLKERWEVILKLIDENI